MEYITYKQVKDVINTDEPFAVEEPLPVGCTMVYLDNNKTIAIVDGDGCPVLRTSEFCAVLLYMRHWLIEIVKIEYRIQSRITDAFGRTTRDMLMRLR